MSLGKRLINPSDSGGGGCSGTTGVLDIFGDNSCIAAYNLNGDALDLGGNYNGTWSGTESYGTGKYDEAAVFGGNASSSKISGSCSFPSGNSRRTVSGWMYMTAAVTNEVGVIGYGDRRANFNFTITVSSTGKLGVRTGSTLVTSGYTVPLNTWIHVMATYDSASTAIWANGSMQNAQNFSLDTFSTPFTFGAGSDQFFEGKIDQVRIFNKYVNNAGQISQLLNETPC